MAIRKGRRSRKRPRLGFEKLEPRRLLASVGWDGAGQGGAELSYYLGDAPAQVGQASFESVVEQALKVWSDVVDINFTRTDSPGRPDSLDITFTSIDGAGGTLARAYYPNDVNQHVIAGDIRFDSAESWEVGNTQGAKAIDLLYVAVHEIGHALGLEHSSAEESVLSSSVSPNQQFVSLDHSDRDAILALYAPAATTPDPVKSSQPPRPEVSVVEPSEPIGEDTSPSQSTNRRANRWSRFIGFGHKRAQFLQPAENSFDAGSFGQQNHWFKFLKHRVIPTIQLIRVLRR